MKSIEVALAEAVSVVSPRAGVTLRRAAGLVRPRSATSADPAAPASLPGRARSRRMLLVNGSLLAGVLVIGVVRLIPAAPAASAPLFPAPAASAAAAPVASIDPAPTAAAASTAPARMPSGSTAVTSPTAGIDPIDLILKTVLVAGLVVLGLRMLKRIQNGKPGSGDGIVVLETRALAPKATLYVVGVRGRQMVVGLTPAGLTTLTEFAEPAPVPAQTVTAATSVPAPAAVHTPTPGASRSTASSTAVAMSKPEQSRSEADATIARPTVAAPTFGAVLADARRTAPRASVRRPGTGRRNTVVTTSNEAPLPSISVIGRAGARLESTARGRSAADGRAQSA